MTDDKESKPYSDTPDGQIRTVAAYMTVLAIAGGDTGKAMVLCYHAHQMALAMNHFPFLKIDVSRSDLDNIFDDAEKRRPLDGAKGK